eukprot:4839410-Lingulodinium_polyedra.AAC.1
MAEPVFPQQWLRDATFLLAAKGAAAGTAPTDQRWICRRWWVLVRSRAREAGLDLCAEGAIQEWRGGELTRAG